MKKEDKYYLKNEDFLDELKKYRKTKVISDELVKMFYKLARKISNRSNFYLYTYKEDMIAESILTCIKYIDNFDPNISSNPFSYFTLTIINSFKAFLNMEKKQSNIKKILKEQQIDGNKVTPRKRMKFNEEFIEY